MDHFPVQYRLALGIAFFLILATVDLINNGRRATRWREYLFLLGCVAIAMAYGIVNDQITSRISWEYFYYGKELAPIIGERTPPDATALSWQAVRIGAGATWSAGLIAGAAVLFANSRRAPKRAPLTYLQLFGLLGGILLACLGCAIALGIAGYCGYLNWMGEDFREMATLNLWRPRRFVAVYGIHLGGYVGGLLGTIWAVISVWRRI